MKTADLKARIVELEKRLLSRDVERIRLITDLNITMRKLLEQEAVCTKKLMKRASKRKPTN